ncbi:MAG TPA: SDR family oxidoreductase [Solirubrobacterales bacterium]|nr:SDR family oxidoreductase [Solirubrobacterales bacterium]
MLDGDIDRGRGTLLTGATGFLGGEVLARLLVEGDRPVYVLVRARTAKGAQARLERTIVSLLGSHEPWAERAIAIAGDLTVPGLALSGARREWLAERIGEIIHCAASVSFTLGIDESRAINVAGTSRLLDLAALCEQRDGLDCFTHVSTAYVAGTHRGSFAESDLEVGQEFRNAYERSKFEAEVLVRRRSPSLPVQVLRPSIVVGDSRTGWTPAFNVIYWPLRAFAGGSYPAIPADPGAPVDVVPVDYVADAIVTLAGRPGSTYHLTAGERATSVGELIELASEQLHRPPPRIVSPRFYRRTIHPVLLRTGSAATKRALRRSEPYFPYFSMPTTYDDARARAALAPHRLEPPPLRAYFAKLLAFARAAGWGREPVERRHATRATRPPRRVAA